MFAVIYRGSILPGREADYQQAWKQVATYFKESRGSLGSCLHKSEDGEWIAYCRWPDKQTRDASWPKDDTVCQTIKPEIREAIVRFKACIDPDRPSEEICMELKGDLLKKEL
jgi:hypothetical protein